MDWAAIGSRDAVLAVCARFGVGFAQAEDYLLARQLGQADERAGAAEQRGHRPSEASRAMDWGALGSRDAVLAVCERFRTRTT